MRRRNKILVGLCAVACVLYSCGGLKVTGNGGKITEYAESYFKGEGKMLFYIKPIEFNTADGEELSADYTYIKGDTVKKDVIINLSIYGEPPFTVADSITVFYGNGLRHTDNTVKHLFNENFKRHKFTRQSIDMPGDKLADYFQSNEAGFIVYTKGKAVEYKSGKQWRKSHTKIYQIIFW